MSQWHFAELQRGTKIRNPIQGEFFSDEAVSLPGQALVREAIQNSLDAKSDLKSQEKVSVRFYVSGKDDALDSRALAPWMRGAWSHIRIRESGIRNPPEEHSLCRFVVVEDFGTSGLEGDERQWRLDPDRKNRFFAFLRAEGISYKSGNDARGRWGVGKTVFPRSSLINSFFALTTRMSEPTRPLLMGNTVLKVRTIDDREFTPDGWFGEIEQGLVVPIDQPKVIQSFRDTFRIARKEQQSGLSVIVPFADPLITAESIITAVVKKYFWPILSSQLEVTIESPDLKASQTKLTDKTIACVAAASPFLSDEVRGSISLALWAHSQDRSQLAATEPLADDEPPQWTMDLIDSQTLQKLRLSFRDGERLGIRVGLHVKELGYSTKRTHFDVFLQRDLKDEGSVPVFIRSGITIPDVKSRRLKGHHIHSIVIIDEPELSALLGNAETPAHTHWHKDTENFRNRYRFGADVIRFVSDAPRQVTEFLAATEEQQDKWALADFFPIQAGDDGLMVQDAEGTSKPGDAPPPKGGIKPKPRMCDVSTIRGGFKITPSTAAKAGQEIQVRVAYDRVHGSPLKRYRRHDFSLTNLSVQVEPTEHITILSLTDNVLSFRVLKLPFSISILGFDLFRDLFVKVEPWSRNDDSQD